MKAGVTFLIFTTALTIGACQPEHSDDTPLFTGDLTHLPGGGDTASPGDNAQQGGDVNIPGDEDMPPADGDSCNATYPEPAEHYRKTAFRDDFEGPSVDSAWRVASWTEHGGQTGPERCYTQDGYLNMIFVNDSTEGYLSAAMETKEEFLYGRWEARLKPSSVPGVLNSMYTIDWNNTADNSSGSDGTKQEIDIEFLTYTFGENYGKVHFALHEEGKPSFGTNPDIELDFDPSADFHVWGFEVTPEHIQWFVDERVLLTYTFKDNPITVNAPYALKFNTWSQAHWINGPPEADVECLYLIDWVRFIPYEAGCK